MSTPLPLKNKTILVTRPDDLAEPLIQRITLAGGSAIHYPVISICDIDISDALTSVLNHISDFDIAIFISPTSVKSALAKINSLPKTLAIAVIGRSTEAMLKKFGYHAQIVPEEFNTESLLQHSALQAKKIKNKSIVIFRGVGGRELLGDTLASRGAIITYAEIYKRERNDLGSLTADQLSSIDAITISSNVGLQNLFDLTDTEIRPLLAALPLIVPGDRAHNLAFKLGFKSIIQALNATDNACMQALTDEFSLSSPD